METNMQSTPFPPTGFVRLSQILGPAGPIPVSKSTWWNLVRTKVYPQPVKLGPRITAWRATDIVALIDSFDTARSDEKKGASPEIN
jgi:prophage regulatory protein